MTTLPYPGKVSTLRILTNNTNTGLAISPDGAWMAVSNYDNGAVGVYALPSGDHVRHIGGPGSDKGKFSGPQKLAFLPSGVVTHRFTVEMLHTSRDCLLLFLPETFQAAKSLFPHLKNSLCIRPAGNLLVVETYTRRLQEVTLTGEHVRFIGAGGHITDSVRGLAVQVC